MTMPEIDWRAIGPLLWLSIGGILSVMLAVAPRRLRVLAGPAALLGVALAGRSIWMLWNQPRLAFAGMVVVDRFALSFDLLFLATAALGILLSMAALRRDGLEYGEF